MNKIGYWKVLAVTAILAASGGVQADVKTVVSGMQNSGDWAAYSPFYVLCGEAPAGQRIVSHTFSLRGDRACGAWAQCGLTDQSATRVCYQFRMQGHNENQAWLGAFNPNSGVRQSEGVLVLRTE